MKILSVVGARPNFMKIAPFNNAIIKWNRKTNSENIEHIILHTGQHYDQNMSSSFFDELKIPKPHINLGIGSGTHAEQIGKTMIAFEKIISKEKPDWIVVVGDVNATLSCSIVAKKEQLKVCHIEAGLRSEDMSMPEEINRIVTDRLSDLLLVPDKYSYKNLCDEGESSNSIVFVGNIMMDALEANYKKAKKLDPFSILQENIINGKLPIDFPKEYVIMTMHRPSNVDEKKILTDIINFIIKKASDELPFLWPVHPRTKIQLKEYGCWDLLLRNDNIYLLNPISYLQMIKLNMGAKLMLTDSGGLQEECCLLGTPCLTLRWNTERPITLIENGGVSILVGNNISNIALEFEKIINNISDFVVNKPELWDGKTAERCLKAIINYTKQ